MKRPAQCNNRPRIAAAAIWEAVTNAESTTAMVENPIARRLLIRSRVADGHHFTEDGLRHIQHVMTDWFPRAVFTDLTDDTVKIDVLVKKGFESGRSVYNASFLRADDSLIKSMDYDEDRLVGKTCAAYDQKRSGYYGNKDGFDHRLVFYTREPPTVTRHR